MAKIFEKLRKEEDFKKVRLARRSCNGKFVRLAVLKTETGVVRVGIVVSKKVSKLAVVRNKVRRRINVILEKKITNLSGGESWDIVISALPSASEAEFKDLEEDVNTCLVRVFKGRQ